MFIIRYNYKINMPPENSRTNSNNQKDYFSSHFGFLVSTTAAAVGLGNIWRFSSEAAQNGGGIYVVAYIIMAFTIGYPIVFAELAMGRSKNQGVFHTFDKRGKWYIVGLIGVLARFIVFGFYNVVAGWVLGYAWSFVSGYFINTISGSAGDTLFSLGSKQEFIDFFSQIKQGVAGSLIYTALMLMSTVIIIRAGVRRGIERCAKLLMPIFVFMMISLVIYSVWLENALSGIRYYLMPRLNEFSLNGVASAVSQSLMSLSIGYGAILTYGSYMNKKDDIIKSSFIVVSGDTIVSLFAGFFLFAFLGHQGVDFSTEKDIIGSGLAFITLPLIFITKFSPLLATIIGLSFFLLLLFATITSSSSMLDVTSRYLIDGFKINRVKAIYIVAISSFFISTILILSESKINWIFSIMSNSQEYNFHDFYRDCIIRVLLPTSVFLYYLFVVREYKIEEILKEAYGDKKRNPFFVVYIHIAISYFWPIASIFGALHVIYSSCCLNTG